MPWFDILYPVCCIQYLVSYIPYPISCILYPVSCILYPASCILQCSPRDFSARYVQNILFVYLAASVSKTRQTETTRLGRNSVSTNKFKIFFWFGISEILFSYCFVQFASDFRLCHKGPYKYYVITLGGKSRLTDLVMTVKCVPNCPYLTSKLSLSTHFNL